VNAPAYRSCSGPEYVIRGHCCGENSRNQRVPIAYGTDAKPPPNEWDGLLATSRFA